MWFLFQAVVLEICANFYCKESSTNRCCRRFFWAKLNMFSEAFWFKGRQKVLVSIPVDFTDQTKNSKFAEIGCELRWGSFFFFLFLRIQYPQEVLPCPNHQSSGPEANISSRSPSPSEEFCTFNRDSSLEHICALERMSCYPRRFNEGHKGAKWERLEF